MQKEWMNECKEMIEQMLACRGNSAQKLNLVKFETTPKGARIQAPNKINSSREKQTGKKCPRRPAIADTPEFAKRTKLDADMLNKTFRRHVFHDVA